MASESDTFSEYGLFSPTATAENYTFSEAAETHWWTPVSNVFHSLGRQFSRHVAATKHSVGIEMHSELPNEECDSRPRKGDHYRGTQRNTSHLKKNLAPLFNARNAIVTTAIIAILMTASFVKQWFFDPTRKQNAYLRENYLPVDFSHAHPTFADQERIVVEVSVKHFTDHHKLSDISYSTDQLTQALQTVINLFALANVHLAVPQTDISQAVPLSAQQADMYHWYVSGSKARRSRPEKYANDIASMLADTPSRIPADVVEEMTSTSLQDPSILGKMFQIPHHSSEKTVFPSLHLVYYALNHATEVGSSTVLRTGSCKAQFAKKLHGTGEVVECLGWDMLHEPDVLDVTVLTRSLAHEFGHIFGLRHRDIDCKKATIEVQVPLMMTENTLQGTKCAHVFPTPELEKQVSVQELEKIRGAASEFRMRQLSFYRLQGRGPLGIEDLYEF
jgi:hypothetical protein